MLLGALVLFGVLADELAKSQALVSLDRRVDEGLHERATPWLTELMSDVSWLGGSLVLTLVTAAACALLVARRRVRAAAFVALAFIGARVLGSVLKVEFARPRPSFADPVVARAGGYSFPSGHATGSMAVYGALACLILVAPLRPLAKLAGVAAAGVVVTLIGFSRIYLGEHFPSDVIGGWCVALAWIALLVLGGSLLRGRRGSTQAAR